MEFQLLHPKVSVKFIGRRGLESDELIEALLAHVVLRCPGLHKAVAIDDRLEARADEGRRERFAVPERDEMKVGTAGQRCADHLPVNLPWFNLPAFEVRHELAAGNENRRLDLAPDFLRDVCV